MSSFALVRVPLTALVVSSVCIAIFLFGFSSSLQIPYALPSMTHESGHVEQHTEASPAIPLNPIDIIIHALFSTAKISPTDTYFIGENKTAYYLPANPRFKTRLAKEILILDLETRPLESVQHWAQDNYSWSTTDYISAGLFNHYTYARIHGYSYKLVQPKGFQDRHSTWIKPSAIFNELATQKYKFIVFLDADAVFHHMQLPIEWLLNYWDIEPEHSITMAMDPWERSHPSNNADRFHRPLTNTGFMIIQNSPVTLEILRAWHACPSNTRYPGCSVWKNSDHKFHEQSAFGEFIRYDYPDNVREVPCGDANGYPEVEVSGCKGEFVRHFWMEKNRVKADFAESVMHVLTERVVRVFGGDRGGLVEKGADSEILE